MSSALIFCATQGYPQTSALVFKGPDGALVYGTYANQGQTNAAHTVPDFSNAGYKGGGVPIPFVPAAVIIEAPTGGDDSALIQGAIDTVAALPPGSDGFRGAVLIRAGTYRVANTLNIRASGVVIRGEGQQDIGGTKIILTATVQRNLFSVVGAGGISEVAGTRQPVTDALVPVGARSFSVQNASGFSPGDRIRTHHKINNAWITALGMDKISTDPNDGVDNWTAAGYQLYHERSVTAVSGNTVHVDAPFVQAVEDQYGGADIFKISSGQITGVGIESLRLESTFTHNDDEAHGWQAIEFRNVRDGWVRQITGRYFGYSTVSIRATCHYITIEDCANLDPVSITTGGRKYSFEIDDSSNILFQRLYSRGGRHDFVSGSKTPGPNVFLDSLAENTFGDIGPHHRYATGQLYDNIRGGEINVQNRLNSGTGHGWSGAQILFWNSIATRLICEAPHAAMNWAIGCVGSRRNGYYVNEPDGIWESEGAPIPSVRSLYLQQLEDRLGAAAARCVSLPKQAEGPLWLDLVAWAGEGLFGDAVEIWHNTLVRPFSEITELKAVIRDLKLLDAGATTEWSKVSGPGSVTFGSPGALETSLAFDAQGEYVLQFLVNAGGTQLIRHITLTALSAANQPPLALPQDLTVERNTPKSLQLGGFDWDGDTLSFSVTSTPAHGSLSGTLPNLVYTPAESFTGSDSFAFTVKDGEWVSPPASVSLQVVNPDPNLIAHWKFDEKSGLIAEDASAPDGAVDQYNATLKNMLGTEWDGAGALSFNGSPRHLSVPGFKGISGSSPRTLAAWIKTSADGAILAWGTDTTSQKYVFRIETGQLRIEVNGGFLKSTTKVNDNTWRHVALVFPAGAGNVTEHVFYIDGAADLPNNPISKAVNTASSMDVLLGNDQSLRYFTGMMDDVRVYNRALTPAEIASLAASRPPLPEPVSADYDNWRITHFGTTDLDDTVLSANGTHTLREAYIIGVDPADPGSRFLVAISNPPSAGIHVDWPKLPGRRYNLHASRNLLLGPAAFQLLQSNIPWDAAIVTDTLNDDGDPVFYRIDVILD